MIPFKRYVKPIKNIEVIAKRFGIRELNRLRMRFGGENWRKLKGRAFVELMDGRLDMPNFIGMSAMELESAK